MKKNALILLLCFWYFAFSACAQTSFIKKAKAFVSVSSPGTEMVDDDGSPVVQKPISRYTIYVSFSGDAPEWKNAWINNQTFVIHPTKMELKKLDIGIDKSTGRRVVVQADKGTQLWQLELMPADQFVKPPAASKAKEVLLQGVRKNKPFEFRISRLVSLQTPDAV